MPRPAILNWRAPTRRKHSIPIAKIFDIIKYFKNEKNQKLKKKNRENRGNGPKRLKKTKRAKLFFGRTILETKRKKSALLTQILCSGWEDTACDTHVNKKLKNIEKNLKMPYVHFR